MKNSNYFHLAALEEKSFETVWKVAANQQNDRLD